MNSAETDYRLLDAGNGRKLEQFGPVILDRPCAQAVWRTSLDRSEWARAHASFTRDEGKRWEVHQPIPERWQVRLEGLNFEVQPTDFGHVGIFPEHFRAWRWMAALRSRLLAGSEPLSVLNLFAYSGGATWLRRGLASVSVTWTRPARW